MLSQGNQPKCLIGHATVAVSHSSYMKTQTRQLGFIVVSNLCLVMRVYKLRRNLCMQPVMHMPCVAFLHCCLQYICLAIHSSKEAVQHYLLMTSLIRLCLSCQRQHCPPACLSSLYGSLVGFLHNTTAFHHQDCRANVWLEAPVRSMLQMASWSTLQEIATSSLNTSYDMPTCNLHCDRASNNTMCSFWRSR